MIERERIMLRGSVETVLRQLTEDILMKPITFEIASLIAQFPSEFLRDPMDRVVAATAWAEGLPLVTADTRIQKCAFLQVIW